MTMQEIAAALRRVRSVFERRPDEALHDDAPATSSWHGGTRFVTSHPNGVSLSSDLPTAFGGAGEDVTPGWSFRAGLAACAATSILLVAAAEGIELTSLEVRVGSRSDARGMLGMLDEAGTRVGSAPLNYEFRVRITAIGASADRLRTIVEEGIRRSPCPNALTTVVAVELHVDAAES